MGYSLNTKEFDKYIHNLKSKFDLYGPVLHEKKGRYSDTDIVIYKKVQSFNEMHWDSKADYSAKDILLPLNETIFYFVENDFSKPDVTIKPAIVFLRPCDLHAIKRTDQIYLDNVYSDIYYQEKRELIKFAVVGCNLSYENCYCVSFKTNNIDTYDIGINIKENSYEIAVNNSEIQCPSTTEVNFNLNHVTKNETNVNLLENVKLEDVYDSPIWDEYSTRCIGCGACNFVCPTCTCFSMQDIFYDENKNVGERKRVMASCMVDGFTNMAGGMSFRDNKKDRMRFKILHKVSDFKNRFGYNMCVGCGRCDDVCPELIKFSTTVNSLFDYVKGAKNNE